MLNIPYVTEFALEVVRAKAIAGLQELHQDRHVRLGMELDRVHKMVILVSTNYSLNTYNARGNVTWQKFSAKNKRVHILETAKEDKDLVRMCLNKGLLAASACNSILRRKPS